MTFFSAIRYVVKLLIVIGLFQSASVWAESFPLISQDKLIEQQASGTKPLLVDVRTADEFNKGHVPGAINIPFDQVKSRLADFGDKNREIVLYCHSGRRAGLTSQLLSAEGFTQLKHLEGDMRGWEAKQRPIEK